MNAKKFLLFSLISALLFLVTYFGYEKFKFEKNNFIHTSTYISGTNLSGANMFFLNYTGYSITHFFDFEKVNSAILRDYKSQVICKGIFSDKIFKLPITIIPTFTDSQQRVTYEITSDNKETGASCIKDIDRYINNENQYALLILNEVKKYGIKYYNTDGSINYDLSNRVDDVYSRITFFKKLNENSYEITSGKYSLGISLLIICLFISMLIVYYKTILNYIKRFIVELKK